MTLPHQCRCAICGEIGTITPGLPNVFANLLEGKVNETPEERFTYRLDVGGISGDQPPATCVHGYTVCRPCKFPAA